MPGRGGSRTAPTKAIFGVDTFQQRFCQPEQAVAYLTDLQEQFRTKDIEARTCVYYGPVVRAILSAAECECADIIAMASHGRGGLSQVFYGSVAVGVLHRADRPLLLVRSRDGE